MKKFHILNDEKFQSLLEKLIEDYITKHRENTWTDPKTNLMWQLDHNPDQMDWDESIEYCSNLNYAGFSDWKLPSIPDLFTIIDFSKGNPACYIKDTKSSSYWSSTTYAGNTSDAWRVYFGNGDVGDAGRSSTCYCRAVRSVK